MNSKNKNMDDLSYTAKYLLTLLPPYVKRQLLMTNGSIEDYCRNKLMDVENRNNIKKISEPKINLKVVDVRGDIWGLGYGLTFTVHKYRNGISNGGSEISAESIIESANRGELIEGLITSEEVKKFKDDIELEEYMLLKLFSNKQKGFKNVAEISRDDLLKLFGRERCLGTWYKRHPEGSYAYVK